MDIKNLSKGAAAGAVGGLAIYALASVHPMKRYRLKRKADKALKSAECLMGDIVSMFR